MNRRILLSPSGELELEPGRFGQAGHGVQFTWVAPWGADLLGLRILPELSTPVLGWIVESLELDGAEQLVDATPLALLALALSSLPHVRPMQTVRFVVRLGTLDAAAAGVGRTVARYAVLEVTHP